MSREIMCDCGSGEDKKRAIIVKILDSYIGITRLANVTILSAPGPLISKLLIGHKCKIRVRGRHVDQPWVSCAVSSLTV